MKKLFLPVAAMLIALTAVSAPKAWKKVLRNDDPAFFTTAEAARIGDNLLAYQRCTGGWEKNVDVTRALTRQQLDSVAACKGRRDDSTTDNDATTLQMRFLARLYAATGIERYRDGFLQGLDYLLSGQYPDGGWPQFWPDNTGYQVHITYNDDAIANTLFLFDDIRRRRAPYTEALVDSALTARVAESFDRAVECILRTQIVVDGRPTVWCQQHDRETYAPAKARSYELPSFCSQESVSLVKVLMLIDNPDGRVCRAIEGAMAWFDRNKLMNIKIEYRGERGKPGFETTVVEAPGAGPLWARFYDLETCRPFFCDRDGVPRERLSDIGRERRNGYSWYNDHAAALYPLYDAWRARHGR